MESLKKKVYQKPEMQMELFTLSKHIAVCAFDMSNLKSKYECTAISDAVGEKFNVPSLVLYTESNTNCVDKDSTWDKIYCYTNGTEGLNTFNS